MASIKDKARILKTIRERELPTRELPLECQRIPQKKHFRPERRGITIQSNKKQGNKSKTTGSSKAIIQN